MHQLLLFAIADADLHPRIQRIEPGNQLRQVQRRDGFEAANINLSGNHIIVGQCVLFEFLGHAQQFLRLAVEACTTGGQ